MFKLLTPSKLLVAFIPTLSCFVYVFIHQINRFPFGLEDVLFHPPSLQFAQVDLAYMRAVGKHVVTLRCFTAIERHPPRCFEDLGITPNQLKVWQLYQESIL